MDTDKKLITEIEQKRTYFKTDNYPMSIGELSNLYKNKEIVLRPEFQRLFRWTHLQRVKLIESILLGIPIPDIFVYQDDKGIWEIVDGLQRVSTILQFMGLLDGEEKLQLKATKYLPSLEGYYWEAKQTNERELPQSLKLFFKRAKLKFTIILSESDVNAKFEVFQRLNTGGSNASNQEVRNSLMVMINPEIFKWFSKLSTSENFLECISITERLIEEQYHMELLLRFIGLLHFEYEAKKDLGDFLDEINEEILYDEEFPREAIRESFNKTFKLLRHALGDKSFKKYDGTAFKGKFLESAFEAIAVGLAENINQFEDADTELIIRKVKEFHHEETYTRYSGSGSNARTRIPKIVPFAKNFFKKR